MKMAPIPPNFMSIVRLLTTKFVKIGSHFHGISLQDLSQAGGYSKKTGPENNQGVPKARLPGQA
ncbi:MAG: hypothetical protein CSA25_05330 [Desulfobacter postgatei]|uniref:Uncharacterized protein n=1 Tax=Desulfobacter postgatei TaxID=2293 RepID=A0A2G6MR20_9BACT|nr:MAG: hypothetical protein CSA25_05330 [Desulfobacter postgatei]